MTAHAASVGERSARIAAALRRVYAAADWSAEVPEAPVAPKPSAGGPARHRPGHRIAVRPVPLGELVAQQNAVVEEVPGLTRALAAARLLRWGVEQRQLLEDPAPLVGFIYANATAGLLLVRRDDPLPRRRFTIAHELGHLLLHVPAAAGDPAQNGVDDAPDEAPAVPGELLMTDGPDTVMEAVLGSGEDEAGAGGPAPTPSAGGRAAALSLTWQEREANRFAAELLMPEPTVRALYDYYTGRFGRSARFLEGHLAADLLVSRQAVQYRLADLGLGEEMLNAE